MSFTATVLRVLIASPSDTTEARDAVERALHSWNRRHSSAKQVVLLPWRWETSSVPLLGAHPQQLINSQGIDSADIVIALFGSRIGSPTPDAVSGTVEEIQRSVDSGKPVHLYFSEAPLPNDVDTAQLHALRQFKKEIGERGLLGSFDDLSQLESQVWNAIEHDLASPDIAISDQQKQKEIIFHVQSKSERESQGLDHSGKMKYRTRHWYEVKNIGNTSAHQVTFDCRSNGGLMKIMPPDSPVRLDPGVIWEIPVVVSMGVSEMKLLVRWTEENETYLEEFDVQ